MTLNKYIFKSLCKKSSFQLIALNIYKSNNLILQNKFWTKPLMGANNEITKYFNSGPLFLLNISILSMKDP